MPVRVRLPSFRQIPLNQAAHLFQLVVKLDLLGVLGRPPANRLNRSIATTVAPLGRSRASQRFRQFGRLHLPVDWIVFGHQERVRIHGQALQNLLLNVGLDVPLLLQGFMSHERRLKLSLLGEHTLRLGHRVKLRSSVLDVELDHAANSAVACHQGASKKFLAVNVPRANVPEHGAPIRRKVNRITAREHVQRVPVVNRVVSPESLHGVLLRPKVHQSVVKVGLLLELEVIIVLQLEKPAHQKSLGGKVMPDGTKALRSVRASEVAHVNRPQMSQRPIPRAPTIHHSSTQILNRVRHVTQPSLTLRFGQLLRRNRGHHRIDRRLPLQRGITVLVELIEIAIRNFILDRRWLFNTRRAGKRQRFQLDGVSRQLRVGKVRFRHCRGKVSQCSLQEIRS
uniref:(northern house mosquito) hypothetical protein n=1 Tax=Culex pipiens TaxID=7175 RepID=A0A8D8BLQ1_CULPI